MPAEMAVESVSPRCKVKPAVLPVQLSALDAAGQGITSDFRHQPPNSTVTLSPCVSTIDDSFGSLILATPSTSCFQLSLKSAHYIQSLETPRAQSETEDEHDPFDRSFSRFLLASAPRLSSDPSRAHRAHQKAPKIAPIPLPELDHANVLSDYPICDCQSTRKPLRRNRSIVLPDFEDIEAPTPTDSLMQTSGDHQSDSSSISSGLQITLEEEALSASDSDDEMTTGYLRRVEKHGDLRSLWFSLTDGTSARDEG